jgi:hypothetical protein
MCFLAIGKTEFVSELKRLKKRSVRARTNKRAYNKVNKKLQFFEKYKNEFGVVITYHFRPTRFNFKLIKTEELEDEEDEFLVEYPAKELLKNKSLYSNSTHAEQA